uniref:Uncharacterized protein n=1 Tax=Ochrobactrum phage ORM_20 TaxID=2985243 RepID=A0A9N6WSA7_9VIRU|nr:hypothetical protein ORM20_00251 [Ochrobactrum phage ORM_20]
MNFKEFASTSDITGFPISTLSKICEEDMNLFHLVEANRLLNGVYRDLNDTSRLILEPCPIFVSLTDTSSGEGEEANVETTRTIELFGLYKGSKHPFMKFSKNITTYDDTIVEFNIPGIIIEPTYTASYKIAAIHIDRQLSIVASNLFWKGIDK